MPRSQRGFASILLVIIAVVGIVIGVILVQRQQQLKSQASISGPLTPTTSLSLQVSPDTVAPNESFKVTIVVHSDIDSANLFAANLNFPYAFMQVVDIDYADSFISSWVEQFYDNNTGEISLVGGVPDPGYKTTITDPPSAMAVITFKSTGTIGLGTVSFVPDTAIYRNADGTDILAERTVGEIQVADITSTPTPVASASSLPAPVGLVYNLQAGNNFIGIPLQLNMTPKELLDMTAGKCTVITGFEEPLGGTTSYFADPSKAVLNNIDTITGGKAYFLQCSSSVAIGLPGSALTSLPQPVYSINYLSLSKDASFTALDYLKTVSTSSLSCWELSKWEDGGWLSYRTDVPTVNNFTITDQEGVNVRCKPVEANPSPSSSAPVICAQVILPPASLTLSTCKDFATPCDVPASGWQALKGAADCASAGDFNTDGKVNIADASRLYAFFNKSGKLIADLNQDGIVNTIDFSLMINLFKVKSVIR